MGKNKKYEHAPGNFEPKKSRSHKRSSWRQKLVIGVTLFGLLGGLLSPVGTIYAAEETPTTSSSSAAASSSATSSSSSSVASSSSAMSSEKATSSSSSSASVASSVVDNKSSAAPAADASSAEVAAAPAVESQTLSFDDLQTSDISGTPTVTWSAADGAATNTGTKVYPKAFSIVLQTKEAGRTFTWKKGDVITLPDLVLTGAYGNVTLTLNLAGMKIPGLGTVNGNQITMDADDNGGTYTISLSALTPSNYSNLPSVPTIETPTAATATFFGNTNKFTVVDQTSGWDGQIGEEIIPGSEEANGLDLAFKSYLRYDSSDDRSFTGGVGYNDGLDMLNYISGVNADPATYSANMTETTMKKIADADANLYLVNTYPAGQNIITISLPLSGSGSERTPVSVNTATGAITGINADGSHAMSGGDNLYQMFLNGITQHAFPNGVTKEQMKAQLAVGEWGFSKQSDGSFVALVNMGNYSKDGDHLDYSDVASGLWTNMMKDQHIMTPAAGFTESGYQAKMVAANGNPTPPLMTADFVTRAMVGDPSDGEATYQIDSSIEVGGTEIYKNTRDNIHINPVVVDTNSQAAIKVNYVAGSATVAPTKTLYADPNTTLQSYIDNNTSNELFPKHITVGTSTYELIDSPDASAIDFGDKGSSTTLTVHYQVMPQMQINYLNADGTKTIQNPKYVSGDTDSTLQSYIEANPTANLIPKQITVGMDKYQLKTEVDPSALKFGETTTLDLQYEKLANLTINYLSGTTELQTAKRISSLTDTTLQAYIEANPTANLIPKQITVGADKYQLKTEVDPSVLKFGETTTLDLQYDKLSSLGYWTPGTDVNLTHNTGTYGDAGLELLVNKDDPWADNIVGDPVAEGVKVLAKGEFGNDSSSNVKWYISEDGVLHLGSGTTNWVHAGSGGDDDYFKNPLTAGPNGDTLAAYVSPWYQYKDKFTKVSIDGKVTLNEYSPYLFSTLDQVTNYDGLENLDFSGVRIATSMFQSNYAFTTAMTGTGKWDLSKVTNASGMFSNTAMTSLDATGWGMENLTNAASMFRNARGLTQIIGTENWDLSKVTTMQRMFDTASSLVSLNTSGWNTSSVTTMRTMFQNAGKLATLDTSSWDTAKVTDMAWMFSGATSLQKLNTDSWNTANVTNMSYMFNGARAIDGLNTSSWQTDKVTTMTYMFANATALTGLDTTNWNTSNVTDMSLMFVGSASLAYLDTSKWDTAKVTKMNSMFNGAHSLAKVDFSAANTSQVTDMRYMFSDMPALRQITFSPEFVTAQLTSDGQTGNVALPNTTTALKWQNVASGSITAPAGTERISAYAAAVPDTYVLTPVDAIGIDVTVKDDSDKPLANVNVGLYKADGTTLVATATTDDNGAAIFYSQPYGTYVVKQISTFDDYLEPSDVTKVLTADTTDEGENNNNVVLINTTIISPLLPITGSQARLLLLGVLSVLLVGGGSIWAIRHKRRQENDLADLKKLVK